MTATTPAYTGGTTRDEHRTNGNRAAVKTFTETKASYKTSEFLVWVLSVAATLVATGMSGGDSLSTWHGALLVTVLSAAYMLSRGFAKSGSREPYSREIDAR
jgi:hypothetical protein